MFRWLTVRTENNLNSLLQKKLQTTNNCFFSSSCLLHSSRSRSRSRSHTPSYRNYPSRDYQNNRGGFRGYNRGYRRPYHYRGRNRGYYQRGHYQNRGGGGGYGYKSNWQGGGGGGWHDRHHDQDHHSHSPRRGRSRTPKKRSGSRSRSRNSDRSSSGRSQRSRRSRRSSYSSRSRSSSPRHRSSKSKPSTKDAKLAERQAEKSGQAADGSAIEKASGGKWIDFDPSPKRATPEVKKGDASAGPDSKGPGSSAPLWKTVGNVSSSPEESPTKSGQMASGSGFGFFTKEDAKAGDKTVISAAFKKYVCYF